MVFEESAGKIWFQSLEVYQNELGQFSRFISFEVGSGTNITFWDWWGSDGALKDFFTVLLLLRRQLWLIIYVGIWGPCMGMSHFVMAGHDWELAMLN